MSRTVNIFAPSWNRKDSYGRVAHELATHFRGYHVNRLGGHPPSGVIQTVVGGILLAYPTNFKQYGPLASRGPRIAVTMFESTKLPPGWADVLNQMQAVVVPSQWQTQVFQDSGVTVPIHVVPLGISSQFKYRERPVEREPYTFLATLDSGTRKGWHVAAQAFIRAFGDDMRYRLVFKARASEKRIQISNPNIDLVQQDMSNAALARFLGEADCYLFPTAGEGFGLPPREFAATGGAVITTDWSGTADDLAQWGLPIKSTLGTPWAGEKDFEGLDLGVWAEPDIDDLAATMRWVVEHRRYMHERGKQASAFVRKHYRWAAFARQVQAIWERACDGYRAATQSAAS